MDSTLLSAFAALGGSVVGGMTSRDSVADPAPSSKRAPARSGQEQTAKAVQAIHRRGFEIVYGRAVHEQSEAFALVSVDALIGRMRVLHLQQSGTRYPPEAGSQTA
jgi:hypothetical protein